MTQRKQPESYLWDMREAAKLVAEFMRGIKFHKFENNKMLLSAVERQLLIVGEAATHVSPQYRNKHPDIEWKYFIELRNVIAHEYGESLINRLWIASTERVPALLAAIPSLLPEEDSEE